jgi:hypothetical protein
MDDNCWKAYLSLTTFFAFGALPLGMCARLDRIRPRMGEVAVGGTGFVLPLTTSFIVTTFCKAFPLTLLVPRKDN